MTSTIEISYYPLNNGYASAVVRFLNKLKELHELECVTNGMSTIITGSYEKLWPELGKLIEDELAKGDCVFILKIASGRREYV